MGPPTTNTETTETTTKRGKIIGKGAAIKHLQIYIGQPESFDLDKPFMPLVWSNKALTQPFTCREVEGCNKQYRVNEEKRLVCDGGHPIKIRQYEVINFNVVFV
jgi:hypothetical protein